jgi:hypothetical protein
MKHIILPLIAVSGQLLAQSFNLKSGERVQIAYEDAGLTPPQKAMIGADILRTVTPGLAGSTSRG